MRSFALKASGKTFDVVQDDDGKFIIPDEIRPLLESGSALKPAFEPIVLARKPLSEGTVAANVLRWRTGALNIDACRVPSEARPLIEKQFATADTDGKSVYGEGLSPPSRSAGLTTAARWPANVVTDGSAEVVEAFPQSDSARANGNPNNPKRGKNHIATSFGQGDDTVTHDYRDRGSAARFFYSAKASRADRSGSKHPTVKPVALMQWLCRLVCPPGGVILDPFAGSGTTGQAAVAEGFKAILCEREAEYVADIQRRMNSPPLAPE